jgi:hypothetical protein
MSTRRMVATTTMVVLLSPALLRAQTFDSGSNGSDGALVVTQDTTLDVPPDGVFHFTTVTVEAARTLTFRRNALNTPVHILATGNINLAGFISVDGLPGSNNPPVGGAGGPGGFDGGDPGIQSIPPGPGHGPGGGAGGDRGVAGTSDASAGGAAYGSSPQQPSASDGQQYGSPLLVPLAGGSGGGGGAGPAGGGPGIGGSGGGGALLLASSTRIDVGSSGGVNARGGTNGFPHTGQGSGGAVRLVAPVVAGTGVIRVTGGNAGVTANGGDAGGHGRIRVDTIDRTNLRLTYQPLSAVSVGTFMAVFPPVTGRLDIVQAAGQTIAEGSGPVEILLPFGSSPNQTVTIRARDFTGVVPVEVVLTPSSGEREVVQGQITMSTNPAEATINVTLPVNTRTRVSAWTR